MLAERRHGETPQKVFDNPFTADQLVLWRDFTGYEHAGQLAKRIDYLGKTAEDLSELMRGDIFQLHMIDSFKQEQFANFAFGAISTILPFKDLPPDPTGRFHPRQTNLKFAPILGFGGWALCGRAEPRMDDAVADEGTITLTDKDGTGLMIYKFNGRNIALCVEDFIADSGHCFVAGNWYVPTEAFAIKILRKAFDKKFGRIHLPTGGEWAILRAVKMTGYDPATSMNDEEYLSCLNVDSRKTPRQYKSGFIKDPEALEGDRPLRRSAYRGFHFEGMENEFGQ